MWFPDEGRPFAAEHLVYACMMDRDKFESLVDQAIRELPAEFRKKLENVVVIVEDRASEELLDDMGLVRQAALALLRWRARDGPRNADGAAARSEGSQCGWVVGGAR